VPKWRNWQTR